MIQSRTGENGENRANIWLRLNAVTGAFAKEISVFAQRRRGRGEEVFLSLSARLCASARVIPARVFQNGGNTAVRLEPL
jgi:hypothetical protein